MSDPTIPSDNDVPARDGHAGGADTTTVGAGTSASLADPAVVKALPVAEKASVAMAAIETLPDAAKAGMITRAIEALPNTTTAGVVATALETLPPGATAGLVTTAMRTLPDTDKAGVAAAAIQDLPDAAKAHATTAAVHALPNDAQDELIERFAPDQTVTNDIWRWIVRTFALVLAGAMVALVAAVFVSFWREVDPVVMQMLITVFTTTAGILAGIVSGRAGTARTRRQ